jgi:hypothetical protein
MSDLPNGEVNGNVKEIKTDKANLVKRLYGVANERGGTSWLDECPEYLTTASSESPEHALLIRYKECRLGTGKKALNLTSIEIQSPYLKGLLRQIFKNYPGEAIDGEEISFDAPFHPFFHQWATLISVYEQAKNDENAHPEQLEALINVLRDEFKEAMRDARSNVKNGNMIFEHLWTLYPPGVPVLGKVKGEEHCFLVNGSKYLMGEIVPTLAIEMIFLDHDGTRHGWSKTSVFIEAFAGSVKISSLPAVPIYFHEDLESTLGRLHRRGGIAVDLVKQSPAYKSYDGSIRLHRNFDMEEVQIFIEGRIMIDPKFHSQQVERYAPPVSTIPHKVEWLLTRDPHTKIVTVADDERRALGLLSTMENLNQHPVLCMGGTKLESVNSKDKRSSLAHHQWTQGLLGISPESFCRSVVRGYCLSSKSWAEFEIKTIADIKWNKDAFDALVIPPARKRLLEALVRQQQNNKADAAFDDVVQGKGQGLIMLLAGPPGTGKTLTAESIADRLQLPLYAVSSGELGDSSKEIESQFGQILKLAASWDAVLLIDEADAFLEKRVDTPEARDRNKRVAGKSTQTGLTHKPDNIQLSFAFWNTTKASSSSQRTAPSISTTLSTLASTLH